MSADQKKDVLSKITYCESIQHLNDIDFAIEAVNEDFVLKARIFEELAKHTPKNAILASNTSSISISKIAGVIPERAHQVIGMHFMLPVPVMKLIEIITAI